MSDIPWQAVLAAGTVSLLTPLGLRPILRRFAVVDEPNERSSHSAVTLRAGGVAQVFGAVVGLGIWVLPRPGAASLLPVILMGVGVAAALVGLADDLIKGKGVPVMIRGGLALAIGWAAVWALAAVLGAGVLAVIGFGVLIGAYINVANFMDGVNGISAAHGGLVGTSFAVIGMITSLPWLVVTGMLLAVVFLAFLPWNTLGAGMFLGDVGSYFLGATVAATAVAAVLSGVPWLAALAPLSIYLADTLSTLVRRTLRGEPIARAHRTHAYQRLTNTGLSHLQVTAIVSLFTSAAALTGILLASGICRWPVAATAILLTATVYLLLPRWRHDLLPAKDTATLRVPPSPDRIAPRPGFRPRRWAVVGGTGFIGRAVVNDLRQRGLDVLEIPAPRVLLDSSSTDGELVAELAEKDPSVPLLADRLAGIDLVVNAAGLAAPDATATPELFGANALLPAIVGAAARAAGVPRLIHLSSAAVQGRRAVLDEAAETAPFSAYSRPKALGESALLFMAARSEWVGTDLFIFRATSVQGPGRTTTESLRRLARSPLASVAAPGTQPTIVSSLQGLVSSIHRLGVSETALPAIVLQPWEGLSVSDVLRRFGEREPTRLPAWLCHAVVFAGNLVGQVVPAGAGIARRLQILWFGQRQLESALGSGLTEAADSVGNAARGSDD